MRYVNRLGINFEALLKMAALLGFALLFYAVIESGNAQYYVHPRIVPYMKFGIAVFIVISLFVALDLFKPKRKNVRVGRYLLFIIPLILAFALPPKTLDTDLMSLSSMNTMGKSNVLSLDEESGEDLQAYTDGENVQGTVDNQKNPNTENSTRNPNKGLLLQGDAIIMDDNSFAPWIEELYGNLDKYEGKKIQVVGFVFKDKEFKQNEFVPARFAMNCCAADMQPVGILCNYQGAAQLKKDSWVKVIGKVEKGEFKGQKMPVIVVETVEPASKPKNEFVYPY